MASICCLIANARIGGKRPCEIGCVSLGPDAVKAYGIEIMQELKMDFQLGSNVDAEQSLDPGDHLRGEDFQLREQARKLKNADESNGNRMQRRCAACKFLLKKDFFFAKQPLSNNPALFAGFYEAVRLDNRA